MLGLSLSMNIYTETQGNSVDESKDGWNMHQPLLEIQTWGNQSYKLILYYYHNCYCYYGNTFFKEVPISFREVVNGFLHDIEKQWWSTVSLIKNEVKSTNIWLIKQLNVISTRLLKKTGIMICELWGGN